MGKKGREKGGENEGVKSMGLGEWGFFMFRARKRMWANKNNFLGRGGVEWGRRGKMGSGAGGEKRREERRREKDGQKEPGRSGRKRDGQKEPRGVGGEGREKKIIKIKWGNGMAKKRRGERGSLCVGRSRTGNVAHANFGTGSLSGVTA